MTRTRGLVGLLVGLAAACGAPADPDDGGAADGDVALVCAEDRDCDDDLFCNGRERCAPGASDADERGCAPAVAGPCAPGQTCDDAAARCISDCPTAPDADGDGRRAIECGGDDCDDADAARFPGNTEVCDDADHDEDCDPLTYGARDADADGHDDAACCNGAFCGDDCDDAAEAVHPGQPETCDERDDDCDGATDEGVQRLFFPDLDGDGWGDRAGLPLRACAAPAMHVENALDCADDRALSAPGRTEECNAFDDDCDGTVDEDLATALSCADLYGSPPNTRFECAAGACAIQSCRDGYADCDGELSDGCEVDVARDASSCGACGVSCGVGGVCTASVCDRVVEVGAGLRSTCAVRETGVVACWGDNAWGQLGDGSLTSSTTPVRVDLREPALEVALGRFDVIPGTQPFACARTATRVFCWGGDGSGQLGDGAPGAPALTPQAVVGVPSVAVDLMSIGALSANLAVGSHHGCQSETHTTGSTRRTVACWGTNYRREVRAFFDGGVHVAGATMTFTTAESIRSIATGFQHSCAIAGTAATARIQCTGANFDQQLGSSSTGSTLHETTGVDYVEVDAGRDFTCARRAGGTVQCWGANGEGQLGDGTTTPRAAPATVSGLAGVTQVSLGGRHACAVRTTGTVACWGENSAGQLGDGTTTRRTSPVTVAGITDAVRVSAGWRHTCAIRASGRVACWGGNADGQLGDGTTTQRTTPVTVSGL